MGKMADWFGRIVAETCLTIAEKLPRFPDSLIGDLQTIREYQRRDADEAFEKTRAPNGADMRLLYFRLLEVFTIEDVGKLWTFLIDVFPELAHSFQSASFESWFLRLSNDISGGGDARVGIIARTGSSFPPPSVRMPNLPVEVEEIEVWLHKVIPSLFVVTFDVHLAKAATERLQELHGKKYLAKPRFRPMVPFNRRRLSHSANTSEAEMRRAAVEWAIELRAKVEECLVPLSHGFFWQTRGNRRGYLPSIEVYALNGVWTDEERWKVQRERTIRWLESCGLNVLGLLYKNESVMFMIPSEADREQSSAYQMCISPEPYLAGVNVNQFGGENGALCFQSSRTLTTLTASMTIIEMLMKIEQSLERLRRIAFSVMKPLRRTVRRMRDYFTIAGVLGWQATILSRLEMDIQFRRVEIRNELESVKGLGASILWMERNVTGDLQDRCLTSMDRQLDLLGKEMAQVQRAFGDHLLVRNMDAIYRLQRVVVILTVVVTIATIIGVYLAWYGARAITGQ